MKVAVGKGRSHPTAGHGQITHESGQDEREEKRSSKYTQVKKRQLNIPRSEVKNAKYWLGSLATPQ
jgi:hypothetical protein